MVKIYYMIGGIVLTCMLVSKYAPTWWVDGFNIPNNTIALANVHIAYAWVALAMALFVGIKYLHAK